MSRTTDALKRLFGKSGCYVDAQGGKHPLPDDMKFLKSFFRGRVVEKVIDEGAKAFDSERFETPFPEYVDELILNHDSAGRLTSATAMTSKDNAIDCNITTHDYYGSLFVSQNKSASSIGEWLGVTSTDKFSEWHLDLVDTRADAPQITNWNDGRSQVNGGFEATVYYGFDKANKQVYLCCEKDGVKGVIEVNDIMLYHLFMEAPISIVNDFSNLVDKMKLPETWTLDGTFQYLKTKTGESSATLDLDWMKGKWRNLNGSISIDGDAQTVGIVFPENMDAIANDLPACTIGSVLTTASCNDLASKLKTLDVGTSKTIKFESPSYATNLSTEAKAIIEGKNWMLDGLAQGIFLANESNGGVVKNMLYSEDGLNWSRSPSVLYEGMTVEQMAYGNGVCVAVTDSDVVSILRSTDGKNWEFVEVSGIEEIPTGVVWADGHFIMVSPKDGKAFVSGDGLTWTASATSGLSWSDVYVRFNLVYGDLETPVFVINGDSGKMLYSHDYLSWTVVETGLTNCINRVVFGNGRFVATESNSNKSLTSTDGINWTVSSEAVPTEEDVLTIIYGDGKFVIPCFVKDESGVPVANHVSSSIDGLTWSTLVSVGDNIYLACVGAYGQGKFVLVGDMSNVAYSEHGLADWTTVPTGIESTYIAGMWYIDFSK